MLPATLRAGGVGSGSDWEGSQRRASWHQEEGADTWHLRDPKGLPHGPALIHSPLNTLDFRMLPGISRSQLQPLGFRLVRQRETIRLTLLLEHLASHLERSAWPGHRGLSTLVLSNLGTEGVPGPISAGLM